MTIKPVSLKDLKTARALRAEFPVGPNLTVQVLAVAGVFMIIGQPAGQLTRSWRIFAERMVRSRMSQKGTTERRGNSRDAAGMSAAFSIFFESFYGAGGLQTSACEGRVA